MRQAFADTLMEVAESDPRIALVTGDLGFQVFDPFRDRFGQRYVNVGVAEAQMIYTAAGMACEGWRPVAYSIASFATARPFEQIRFCVAYPRLPVTLVGAGRGYLYGTSGVSHHAADDLALMSALPGMTVVAPGDPTELRQLLPQVLRLDGPAYITVGRYGEPAYEALEPATIGCVRLLRDGERVAIVTTGEVANEALRAVTTLSSEGIRPMAWQMHTVKPLDESWLERMATAVRAMVVVEEHVPSGGLWSAIAGWYAERGAGPRLVRLGARDAFVLGNPRQAEIRRDLGIDAAGIADACRALWRGGITAAERSRDELRLAV